MRYAQEQNCGRYVNIAFLLYLCSEVYMIIE